MLVDRYNRPHTYLRISVTDRCNLRCAYCMPFEKMAWKPRQEILTFEEIVRIARVGVENGIEKIRITGGEPLIRNDIELLMERLRTLPGLKTLALTTNAVLLARSMETVRRTVDSVNISLDTFQPDRFRQLTLRDTHADVMAGIEASIAAGYDPVKVNAVIMRGVNDDELLDFVRFTLDRPIAFRFIEFMPFAGNDWSQGKMMGMDEMVKRIDKEFLLERLHDPESPISRDYAVIERSTGRRARGSIGFIASMSQPFCSSCSRLRLTAEGKIMPCLHMSDEFDVRDVVRSGGSDDDILAVFQTALNAKWEAHPSGDEMAASTSRVMIQIGG